MTDARRVSNPVPGTAGGEYLLPALQHTLRSRDDGDNWQLVVTGLWCQVAQRGHQWRTQGWKLHVSATVPLADTVFARVLPVRLEAGCAFKFAATLEALAEVNSGHAPRGAASKFLTVYPDRDADVPELAAALHRHTNDLAGPLILSDRPYQPGSLVHYRYGSFVDQKVLCNDGFYRDVVYSPTGEPVEDRREARFAPPPWAPPIFPSQEATRTAQHPAGSRPILLAGRFLVREAIRHANKGGVYRACEQNGGTDVVIKEARPHVAVTPAGSDARDTLRTEARVLATLAPLGITPRVVALFEQGEHVFLAEELIAGIPLRRWVLDRVRQHGGTVSHLTAVLPLAERLVLLLQTIHQAGLVVRDFNPNNIMVLGDMDLGAGGLGDGQLRLIDLELAAAPDAVDYLVGGTPGYSAPEQMRGAAPAMSADLFSLGAVIGFVLTGADPVMPEDQPAGRALGQRLERWLSTLLRGDELRAGARQLVLGLMHDQPDLRWSLTNARDALQDLSRASTAPISRSAPDESLSDGQWEEAVEGIVSHLLATMTPNEPEHLWPMAGSVSNNDPCNVAHGAAGVLGALTWYYELTGDQRLPTALATAGGWIERRLRADAFRPPGLYFGLAGTVWALHDAARIVADDGLTERATQLALSLPLSWPNPDLTHGTAGLGITALHLWQTTGDEQFAHRTQRSAETLIGSMVRFPEGVGWQTSTSFDSLFAGEHSYGFAHGAAGIGYFLLAAGASPALPSAIRQDCLTAAEQAGETLMGTVLDADGGARWCDGPGSEAHPMPYWCSGSAGVGTFLVRLSRETGNGQAGKLADLAARSAALHAPPGPLGQCHGMAGNGELLLDMAQAMGDQAGYRSSAHDIAHRIFARRIYRHGATVFPDEHNKVTAEWGSGLSGILAFLLRLTHGGSRRWMADAAGWESGR